MSEKLTGMGAACGGSIVKKLDDYLDGLEQETRVRAKAACLGEVEGREQQ